MKLKLFYGWYIVAASMVLHAYFGATLAHGWTAYINPIAATFGWSMTQISLASSLRGLETGVFNPIWGVAVDRWSPKKLMILGLVSTALGAFLLSQMKNLAMYYGGFLITGLGSSLVMSLLPQTVIARWFKRDFGKANGAFYIGGSLAGMSVPLVVKIVDKFGWQTTLVYSAIGFLVLGIPLSFIFRSRPADYGLLPDGREPGAAIEPKVAQAFDSGTSIKEALKMRAFWHLTIITLFQVSAMSTVNLFALPYLTSLGMDRASASNIVMLNALISLIARVPIGMLVDIFKKSYVLAFFVVLQGIGLLIFWLMNKASPFWLILLFAATYGPGYSAVMTVRGPILAEYFGTKNFGTIFGLTSIFMTVASVVSQPLAGWIYDTYQSYRLWWLALVAFAVVALIATLTIPAANKATGPARTQKVPPPK